jgi:lantibiotic biosynthesis protein
MPKTNYQNFNQFILRTPLYSLDFLQKLLREHIDETQFKTSCNNSIVKEAIFLASPNLHSKIEKWLKGELTDKKELTNLPQAIYKYLARMSSRCTPFGLFAGNSVGEINAKTNLNIPVINDYKRVTRLDMNYLCSLAQDLLNNKKIREQTLFYPNNGIYQFGDKLRYTEYYYHNTKRVHHIAAVDCSDYLLNVFEKAKNGTKINELAEILVDEEISIEEATGFIHELIDSQLLVPEFEPSVTGEGFLENILNFLKNQQLENNPYHFLYKKFEQLTNIDNQPPGIDVNNYLQFANDLANLSTKYELKYLFQSDMIKPCNDLSISNDIVEQIKEGVKVLNKFSLNPTETNLTKFRDAFYKKYEDAEIPLLQALDTESGIGYLQNHSTGAGDYSPLVDNILLPQQAGQTSRLEWNNINSFLLKKYINAISEKEYEVHLTNKDLKEFNQNDDLSALPPTISSMVQLVKLNDELKIVMSSAGGSSAANLLGRFCHTDGEISSHVQEIIKKEEDYYKDKIVAEIIHLPESRTGNILHRPVLRRYEIPYLAKSSVAKEYQILPEDLVVSVKQNRVVLRSKKLNKEIVPRLTTAHNYSYNALPVYQFLCDMQTQDNKRGGGQLRAIIKFISFFTKSLL